MVGEIIFQKLKKAQLIKRSITTVILLPIVLYIIYKGGQLYNLAVFIIACLVLYEWVMIVKKAHQNGRVLTKLQQAVWYIIGILYAVFPGIALIYLRNLPYVGYNIILWLCILVWTADIAGYLVGNIVGGAKIMPKISPSKTWSGFGGAVLFAMLASMLFQHTITHLMFEATLLAAVVAVIAQIGDFLESAFKRYFKVKDSGNILPGHGGVMDRIDGLVLAAVFLAICFIGT